jgi:hypothetical protein
MGRYAVEPIAPGCGSIDSRDPSAAAFSAIRLVETDDALLSFDSSCRRHGKRRRSFVAERARRFRWQERATNARPAAVLVHVS